MTFSNSERCRKESRHFTVHGIKIYCHGAGQMYIIIQLSLHPLSISKFHTVLQASKHEGFCRMSRKSFLPCNYITKYSNYTIKILIKGLQVAYWVKNSAYNILKYCSQFSHKKGLDISCKLSYELLNPISWRKKIRKYHKFDICCICP